MNSDLGKSRGRKLPGWVLPALGYTASIASLVWVFRGFNWRQALEDFSSLDWRYVTIAVACDLSIYLCGGWRWTILVRPVSPASFWRAVQAIYIGLYANEILPLRSGEIIRCYLMAHWNRLPMMLALSSAAIERILEGVWLVIAFVLTTIFVSLPVLLVDGVRILAVILAGSLGVITFIALRKHHAHAAVSESRWAHWLRQVVDGVHAMGNWRTMSAAAAISLLYLILQIVPVWALLQGYGLELSIWAASAVLIILRLGTVVPNAPGNVGLYQFFCVLGLGLFGVPKSTAVGFSLMMFGVLTLPLLIGGFVAVVLSGLKLRHIHDRARSSVQARLEVSPE